MTPSVLPQLRRWLASRRTRLILLAAALLLGPSLAQLAVMQVQDYRLSRELRRRQAVYDSLRAERERLQHDPVYVEGLVRSTFKVAKPGELVVPLSEGVDPSRR